MKLVEISNEVSAERFKSVVRDLVSNTYRINGILEDMISRGTGDAVRRTAAGLNARWFSLNYPTLQSTAMALRSVNKNFDVIAKVPVNAYLGGANGTSKGAGFRITQAALQGALASVGGAELYQKYVAAVAKTDSLIENGMAKDEPVAAPKQPAAVDPRKAVVGSQNSQAEMIVNQAIKDLPTELQHEARAAVGKADNKLVALQQFMKSKGL